MTNKTEALQAIENILLQDPKNEALTYSNQCFEWLQKLNPSYSEAQEFGARCQHFKRWDIPRSNYPMDKKGYYQWRIYLYQYQAEETAKVLAEAGYKSEFIDEVKDMIAKKDIKKSANSQLIEDVACLVFLQHHIAPFAATKDYSDEKWIKIITRTWGKMSEKAHKFALEITYPEAILSLIKKAIAQ